MCKVKIISHWHVYTHTSLLQYKVENWFFKSFFTLISHKKTILGNAFMHFQDYPLVLDDDSINNHLGFGKRINSIIVTRKFERKFRTC